MHNIVFTREKDIRRSGQHRRRGPRASFTARRRRSVLACDAAQVAHAHREAALEQSAAISGEAHKADQAAGPLDQAPATDSAAVHAALHSLEENHLENQQYVILQSLRRTRRIYV